MKLLLSLLTLSFGSQAIIHDIRVEDNNFSPANIIIQAGDTIRWENFGFQNHNVASQDAINFNFRCANGCDANGGNGNDAGIGWISEVTFHQPSSNIPYVCEPHENIMTGSLKVLPPQEYSTVTINPINGFEPQEIFIYKGERVFFINQGGSHNIKADDDSFLCADGCRDDGMSNNQAHDGFPWQFYKIFNQTGTITYHCENPGHTEAGVIHVIVEPPIFANGFESP